MKSMDQGDVVKLLPTFGGIPLVCDGFPMPLQKFRGKNQHSPDVSTAELRSPLHNIPNSPILTDLKV